MDSADHAFAQYLTGPDAQNAPDWQLDALACLRWPANARVTPGTYVDMRAALETSRRSAQAQPAG